MYMDNLHTDMNREARATPFFKRWRPYIEASLTEDEIITLITTKFKFSTWYAKASLKNNL